MGQPKTIPFEIRGGLIWIKCPACKREQILPENDKRQSRGKDGYDIDRGGKVTPEWVCMAKDALGGYTCFETAFIQLREW